MNKWDFFILGNIVGYTLGFAWAYYRAKTVWFKDDD